MIFINTYIFIYILALPSVLLHSYSFTMSQCPPAPKKQSMENPGNGDLQPRNLFGNHLPLPLPEQIPLKKLFAAMQYTSILNAGKNYIDGEAFSKLNEDECRELVPYSPEWVRDYTHFEFDN